MKTFSYFISIDISKATLDFAVVITNKLLLHFQSSNGQKGIGAFISHLKQRCPEANFTNSLYCMEHTSIYNNHILSFLHVKQAHVWLEHPMHIKDSLGMIRGKDDKIDAQRIAVYARAASAIKIVMRCVCGFLNVMLSKNLMARATPRLTAIRNRLVKARKMLQVPLTDSNGFISKKEHNEAKNRVKKQWRLLTKTSNKCKKTLKILSKTIHI